MRSFSAPAARRLALTAQGFATTRPAPLAGTTGSPGPAGVSHARGAAGRLRRVLGRTGALQIDSVNVLARAHYLPAWSRLGAYPTEVLDGLAYRKRELFEYWGHEASLLPVELHPLLRWRMARAREAFETWGAPARLARERPGYIAEVLAEVRDRGPLSAAELVEAGARRTGDWGWNWHDGKIALEWLFWTGAVTTSGRRHFHRIYDLTERVIPRAILELPTPSQAAAQRALLLRAADSLGVATAGDLADYYRIKLPEARAGLAELVAAGELEEVRVAGWRHPAYVRPGLAVGRPVSVRALVSPFDPLIWERARTLRLFGFHYRIEIYVPAARRVHGYYVLPFLLGDSLVARVDLKADRQAGVLQVPAAYAEAHAPPTVAEELAGELVAMAAWLELPGGVRVARRGDLAAALARAIRAR
ncbi:MAG TPA: crosslink repair DNA glycosylase YcaQ family protein [Mycobacteriales bacterium]|nr:crosslink repair DNA glycosylase YcaQ family protein [Mycobacteriales bacterium]